MPPNNNNCLPIPEVKESCIIHEEFVKIRRDSLLLPGHDPLNYYTMVPKGNAVIILGITEDGEFVLNEEYRHPTGKVLLCCPGGYIDEGESPIEGAKREFLEETGYKADAFILLGTAYPYPGLSEQLLYYVLAKGVKKVADPHPEAYEIFRTVLKTRSHIRHSIKQNIPIDGTLCTAFFFYDCYLNF